ncbi:flagellar basal body rod protein FlgB [Halarcobacter anaerophilus]|uniref:Flagellar basal body rod protein FlgB n=1 Tax=Halarcobacter anaerophilus TaxID=877500 RepID=A0A4Q0Y144_9BACT|nr:flagellar basal body rod protein FlgB [Halarcobacter anaerophilus]QDF29862.1 flagellar proximal rod protein FlgB [Halarcobacter anaerophilus]RXJ62824.1 flagellar basal body rod protein FlgB [Halarcobacter anaerophilus]
MKASSVTDVLFEQLSFRGERQKVISSNIANINTPNYKTKDLVFDEELKKVDESKNLALKTTNPMHIKTAPINSENMDNARVVKLKGLEEQNDGNNVNIDREMSEMSKNKVIFDALQSSIKKDSALFRSVIEASQKN